MQYSRTALANAIVQEGYDTASAAVLFSVTTRFIEAEQKTQEYQRIHKELVGRKNNKDTQNITRISENISEENQIYYDLLVDEYDIQLTDPYSTALQDPYSGHLI